MGRSLLVTLKKHIVYCKPVKVHSCMPFQRLMTVFFQTFSDVRVTVFSTKGRFLVSEPNNSRHEKVDVKRVATEIQENDETQPKNSFSRMGLVSFWWWMPCKRFVDVTFFRHLYRKCDYCTYFTSDIGALGYLCPHCRRDNWPSPGLYIARTRWPEQPMHSVWYRSAPNSYMVTDDLESYPLSHHKEMCHTSEFLSKQRKTDEHEEIRDRRDTCLSRLGEENRYRRDCLSLDEVLKKLGKWEDQI